MATRMNAASTFLTAGVLGGMGPEATVDFMAKVLTLTPARVDQDHVPMLVDNNPQVPDRQAAINADDRAVRGALAAMAARLEAAGADFLVMPCNTAHAFVEDAIATSGIPFVSIIETTIDEIVQRRPEARTVGLLATDACLASQVYQRSMDSHQLKGVLPDVDGQHELMRLIFSVKAGDSGPAVRDGMAALAQSLEARGAEAVIAGCTEIPLVLREESLDVPLFSSTDVLAQRTVDIAMGVRPLVA